MATKNPRPSPASTAEVASMSENPRKMLEPKSGPEKKKRPALTDITNRQNGPRDEFRVTGALPKSMVPCSTKNAQKKSLPTNTLPVSATTRAGALVPYEDETYSRVELPSIKFSVLNSLSCMDTPVSSLHDSTMAKAKIVDASPMAGGSLAADETMSTCDSLKSTEFECMGDENLSGLPVVLRNNTSVLDTRHDAKKKGKACERDIFVEMEPKPNASTADDEDTDSKLCAIITLEIYRNLRDSEDKKRPSFVYMERAQRDVNSSMRAILIDWLVEVAEEYRLVPETLYLTVSYIDRYLSGNSINRKQLQLLGVACMMIAAKYEEISIPMVEEFCYVTDNTYSKEEVLQMETSVLNHLKFDMAAPTAHCFLRLFIPAAQKTAEIPSVKFECLASYITELSLVEYCMLRYAPSMIAASAIFLARFMLSPSEKPWNSTLRQHTSCQASDLCDCVKALHRLCLNSCPYLPAVREKYSRHKYKFVAKKYCPATIPPDHFQD